MFMVSRASSGPLVTTSRPSMRKRVPASGGAWLANRLAPYDEFLPSGQVILAGSFTRAVFAGKGDVIHADFDDLGAVTCRFR